MLKCVFSYVVGSFRSDDMLSEVSDYEYMDNYDCDSRSEVDNDDGGDDDDYDNDDGAIFICSLMNVYSILNHYSFCFIHSYNLLYIVMIAVFQLDNTYDNPREPMPVSSRNNGSRLSSVDIVANLFAISDEMREEREAISKHRILAGDDDGNGNGDDNDNTAFIHRGTTMKYNEMLDENKTRKLVDAKNKAKAEGNHIIYVFIYMYIYVCIYVCMRPCLIRCM